MLLVLHYTKKFIHSQLCFVSNTAALQTAHTLNNGVRTAEPALPNSNALMSCGRMLSLQKDVGNKSRDDGRLLKKLFLAS